MGFLKSLKELPRIFDKHPSYNLEPLMKMASLPRFNSWKYGSVFLRVHPSQSYKDPELYSLLTRLFEWLRSDVTDGYIVERIFNAITLQLNILRETLVKFY